MTRCCCQGADHGDGRGQHQRTWAGNHQQGQGLVQRIQPRPAQQQRGQHGQRHRQHHHDGRVDGGKAVNKTLGGRFAGLGLFHGFDDARQHGVGGGGRDLHLQLGLLVDAACPHAVAQGFVHGHAFASDGGLVDAAVASGDGPIQRNAGAGGHAHGGTSGHLGGGLGVAAAVGLQHFGGVGCQAQQVANGQAGTVHGPKADALPGCATLRKL